MRIAQIAPLTESVPPRTYGGTERVVHALTEELTRRGHEVTLFASGDSNTTARLSAVYPRALRDARVRDPYGTNSWTLLSFGTAYARQGEFDIIHDHLVPLSLPTANLVSTPVVATLHGAANFDTRHLLHAFTRPYIISISKAQLLGMTGINHIGTVYNGLPMAEYPFGAKPGEYLLFVGRLSMEKGVHVAIETALELDMPLVIAAKLDDADRDYFRRYIEPRLSRRIQWIGEVDQSERNKLMAGARCFLHPALWREPFGLTLIEAMACGAPVVAFGKGSIPEIVKDAVTGYVVEDVDEMVEAVEKIEAIDRSACRAWALEAFSAENMADNYERIYEEVLRRNSAYDESGIMGHGNTEHPRP